MIKIPYNEVKKILVEDFLQRFSSTKFYKSCRNVRDFFLWIVKVIQYARFLWNDRDFDHGFVLRLLAFKLERTRNRIVKNNFVTDVPQIDKEIARAIELIEKISDNSYIYLKSEWEKHYEKYPIVFEMNKDGKHSWKLSGKELKAFNRLQNKSEKLKEADKDELFCDLLRNKLFGWWD